MCEQILVVRIFCIIFAREKNNNITMNRIMGIMEESTLRENKYQDLFIDYRQFEKVNKMSDILPLGCCIVIDENTKSANTISGMHRSIIKITDKCMCDYASKDNGYRTFTFSGFDKKVCIDWCEDEYTRGKRGPYITIPYPITMCELIGYNMVKRDGIFRLIYNCITPKIRYATLEEIELFNSFNSYF